jgi:hypothetical protein
VIVPARSGGAGPTSLAAKPSERSKAAFVEDDDD